MKELACLYAVSRDIQEDLSTEELCRGLSSTWSQPCSFQRSRCRSLN